MLGSPLYRKRSDAPFVKVIALLCASGCAGSQPTSRPTLRGFEDPETALEAFGAAWNAGDPGAVGRTFAADRRAIVRSHLEAKPQRLRGFEVVGGTVSPQCHPRGAYWKTATVQLRAREATLGEAAQDEEIVWLRLQDGYWFMYSL